ncbi:MAG: LysM peptidoglycan-binding domain-containing protein [Ekhidna sp.]|nr:LysM peptidoglycan-binding domain-containing protein [Ekhidna sp.]
MRFALVVFSVLVLLRLEASVLDSVRSEQRDGGLFVVHEVEEKETLYSIAKRYGTLVAEIIKQNEIVDNKIDIGQLLFVKIDNTTDEILVKEEVTSKDQIHIVQKGETLYSLSKQYNVTISNLKEWNNLTSNDLSLGMQLKLSRSAETMSRLNEDTVELSIDTVEVVSEDPFANFEKYLVQTGETISTIADKLEVRIDSLKIWNNLINDYLRIGQELFYKKSDQASDISLIEPKQSNRSQIDDKGFEKFFEEGVASVIEAMDTKRFLALHRSLPIGTNLEVRNLMNNQVVHVKVVGRLPDTGLNRNLLLRLSQPAYDQLGILDSKSRVEVSYYKQ